MKRTYEHEIDGITGQPVAGNCVARHPFALKDFKTHANDTRKDNVGRHSISGGQSQNPWQPLVCKFEDHKDDQPDAKDTQAEDEQALQKTFQQSHDLAIITQRTFGVRFGLFDHLISLRNQSWADREAKRFSGLKIDHELKFDWPFNRQIGRIGTLENLIYEMGLASIQVPSFTLLGCLLEFLIHQSALFCLSLLEQPAFPAAFLLAGSRRAHRQSTWYQ